MESNCIYCDELQEYKRGFVNQYSLEGDMTSVPPLCAQESAQDKCTLCHQSKYHHLIFTDRNSRRESGVVFGYAIEYLGNTTNLDNDHNLYCPIGKCGCCQGRVNYKLSNHEYILRISITDGMYDVFGEHELVKMFLERAPCHLCPTCSTSPTVHWNDPQYHQGPEQFTASR